MSIDLLEQLAQYGADHRARQASVDMPEILGQVRAPEMSADGRPFAQMWSPRYRFLIAAAVVAFVVAALAWLTRANEPEPVVPADTAVVTSPAVIDAETTPTTVATSQSPFAAWIAPGELVPALSVPVAGETQRSIVGDIAWSVVEGDSESVPDVMFEADGMFFGATGAGRVFPTPPEQWWSTTDGVTWTPTDLEAPNPLSIRQTAETVWASSSDRLFRWDDGRFVPVDVPLTGSIATDGLVVRRRSLSTVTGLEDALVVRRNLILAIPWTELLGVESPSEVIEQGEVWEGTFRLREAQCTGDADGEGRSCAIEGAQWRVRPEIVDADPVRIDFYNAATDELITSITPPDVGQPMEDVLFGIGFENAIAVGDELLIVRDDRVDALRVPWSPADATHYAALGNDLFALVETGERAGIWISTDLENWERRSDLPSGDDRGNFWLAGDGAKMVLAQHELDTGFRANWTTTDGRSWTAANSALSGHNFRIEPTDFGWFQQGDPNTSADPSDPPDTSPSIAVSPDGETWQIIPIPEPRSLSDNGLTWADAAEIDFWGWYPEVHADTIFITLIDPDGGRTVWVGHVDG